MKNRPTVIQALKTAFPHTIPIFAGFWFLGLTYGVYMNSEGFSFLYPMCMSFLIFAGSMEFVTVSLLLAPFNPLQAFLLTLMINARHLFYGISMLDKFRGTGKKKAYLIYGMCDETFSINYSAKVPQGVDRGWFMFWVTALNQLYWVSGATIGGIFGAMIPFNPKGLGFAMTAMFVVIFMEQWLKEKCHESSILGFLVTGISLALFGAENFIVPAMLVILILLSAFRKPFERRVAP